MMNELLCYDEVTGPLVLLTILTGMVKIIDGRTLEM